VERLLDDVRDQAGGLPLLQHALLELWAHCQGGQLTHTAYGEIGGVAGALQRRAEMVYQALSPTEQEICQRVFLRLTQLGEGMVNTSRRATFAELLSVGESPSELENVVQKLADARLVTTGGDETLRSVEVAHEALIQGWRRFRAWIDENRESLLFSRRLVEAAREWADNQRDASFLYWGTRLAQAELWAEAHPEDLSALQQAFLAASQAARDEQRRQQADAKSRRLAATALERLWDNRELALLLAVEAGRTADTPEAYAALRDTLLHRRTIRLVGHAGAVKHVSWDRTGTRVATASADGTARVWSLASSSAGLLAPSPAGSLRSSSAGSLAPSPAGSLAPQDAVEPVRQVVLDGHTDEVWWVAWSKADTRLATASDDGTAMVWNAESGDRLAVLAGHNEWVYHVAWSPDDTHLVTAGGDGTARVWQFTSSTAGESDCGAELVFVADHRAGVAPDASSRSGQHRLSRVVHAAWNGEGTRFVTACADGTARLWDLASGSQLLALCHDAERRSSIYRVRWSSDDRRIVTASYDHTARVWLLAPSSAGSLASSSAGSLASSSAGSLASSSAGSLASSSAGSLASSSAGSLASSSAGSLASSSAGDAESGAQLAVLAGHAGSVYYATWSPDGTRIVTVSADDTARIWDANDGSELAVLSGHTNQVRYAAWNPAGTYVVTVSDDGTARIWDASDGSELAVLQGHTRGVGHVSWNRAGTRFATASDDGMACVWHVADIEQFVIQADRLDTQDLLGAARQRAVRNMSREEWKAHVGDEPYRKTCPGKSVPD
jgi:WD40 repeat protein